MLTHFCFLHFGVRFSRRRCSLRASICSKRRCFARIFFWALDLKYDLQNGSLTESYFGMSWFRISVADTAARNFFECLGRRVFLGRFTFAANAQRPRETLKSFSLKVRAGKVSQSQGGQTDRECWLCAIDRQTKAARMVLTIWCGHKRQWCPSSAATCSARHMVG